MELGTGGVQRFHVEAAAVAFVVLALFWRWMSPRASTTTPERVIAVPSAAIAGGAIAVAFVIYWPALWVGWLADDFVLVERVTAGNFAAVTPQLFRPVPLLVWSLALEAGGGAPALHALNIIVHGLNAFLAYRIVVGWIGDEVASLMAGLLFLLTPLAVEPVTWCSGVFDLSAMSFCFVTLLAARSKRISAFTFAVACLSTIFAILCKETAVVLPALLIIDAAIRRNVSRRLASLILCVGLISVGYASVRLFMAFGATQPPISKYVLQRTLFNTFAALAIPFPSNMSPLWLTIAGVLVLLLTAYVLLRERSTEPDPLLLAAWCLACVVPVYPILFISSNLEGSRYLYESMVGWAAFLAIASCLGPARFRTFGMFTLCLLLAINVVGARLQLQAWRSAATQRDAVAAAARANDEMQRCHAIAVTNLPDSVMGAYVLRNGSAEFFKGVGLTIDTATPNCRFNWSSDHQAFVRDGH